MPSAKSFAQIATASERTAEGQENKSDTTQDIIYRNFKLNDSGVAAAVDSSDGIGKGIAGCIIDEFDPDDMDVVQFMEKRAEADGMDVGKPFLGGRRLRISGTIYGKTRALGFDAARQLRAVLDPVLASREVPADKGYLPLYFSEPTNNVEDFPTGAIAMRALVMPKGFRSPINRDQHGGTDDNGLAMRWSVVFNMRDPKFEGATPQEVVFADTVTYSGATASAATDIITKAAHGLAIGERIYFTGMTGGTGLALNTTYYVHSTSFAAGTFKVSTTSTGSAVDITADYSNLTYARFQTIAGNFLNRGTYNAPLNMIFAVGALAGKITVAVAGSNYNITIPASTGSRIIRFKRDKIITVEEGGIETLRRSWLAFTNATTWPLIPAGDSAYTVTINGTTLDPGSLDGSKMWFWEQYA